VIVRANAKEWHGHLHVAIENGVADPADATLKERIAGVRTGRDIAHVAFDRAGPPDCAAGEDSGIHIASGAQYFGFHGREVEKCLTSAAASRHTFAMHRHFNRVQLRQQLTAPRASCIMSACLERSIEHSVMLF
jgi:hypothetical protein